MKKYITSSFFYLVIGFLPLASNFLLTPFFTRYLLPVEYGILALAALFQGYLTIFLSVGIDSAFSRLFYQYYRKPKLLNAFFSTVLCCVAGISVLYSLALYFWGNNLVSAVFNNNSFTYAKYGDLILVTTITSLLHALTLAYYRNLENIKAFAVLAVSFFLLMTIGAVTGVIILELGAWGSLAGKAAGSVMVVLLFLMYFYSRNPIVFKVKFLKPVFAYGLPVIPYLLIGISLDNLDRFLIERYVSLDELGKYNIAFLIASVMAVILQSLSSAVNPAVFRLLETKGSKLEAAKAKEINLLFRGVNLFILVVIALLIAFSAPLVLLLIDSKYHSIIYYLPLLLLAFIPRVYYVIYSLLLFYHHKTKLLPVINLVALVLGGAAMFLFLYLWGILGICMGVIAIKFIQAAMANYYIRKSGYFDARIFAMRKNHILAFTLLLLTFLSVMGNSFFPGRYLFWYGMAGLIFLVLAFLFFRSEIVFYQKKLLTILKK